MCVIQGGLPGDPMTSPLAATMQPGTNSAASGSAPGDAAAHTHGPVSVPAHSSEQQVEDLPIFNQDPNAAGASVASGAHGMPLTGIHISSSIVTGGLPFGNMGAAEGGAAGGASGVEGAASEAQRMDGMPNPDGSTDVGGMIIQLELPQDGGSVTSIQTTGIGQLGSVLQNMMQEQLAFARERIRDQSGGTGTGAAGGTGAGGTPAAGPASGAAATGVRSTLPANPAGAPARAAGSSEREPGAGAGSTTAALSLPTQVLRLTQQLVSDVRRQQALPEEERDAEAARLARAYLQQVPDMLRSALPQVAAGVNDFMQRGQGPDTAASANRAAPADVTARSSAAAAVPAASPTAPAADPLPATSTADARPAAQAQPTAAAAFAGTAEDAAPKQGNSQEQKDVDAALDAEARFRAAIKQASEGASTSSAALAGGSSSAGPSRAGPSLPKRPEPKGLAGGLKPRKARSSASAPAAAGTASGSVPAAASTVAVSAPSPGLPTGGSGAAAGGSGGGGGPLDMLMPLMQSPQMQQMLNSPQVQGMAEQMSSGNADLGSLMQSMMPMVSSMLGGGPAPPQDQAGSSVPAGRGARSAGAGTSHASSMPPAASAEMKAMLVQELGQEEAARWQKVLKEDKGAVQRASKFAGQRSSAYVAGSTRDAEGDKGMMF